MSDLGYYDQSYPPSLWAPPEPEPPEELFDPGEHTIADVQAYVDEHPDEAATVLAAEQARGNQSRTTLVAWLDEILAADPATTDTATDGEDLDVETEPADDGTTDTGTDGQDLDVETEPAGDGTTDVAGAADPEA